MKRHVGSSFDELLAEEGILSETDFTAHNTSVLRFVAFQVSWPAATRCFISGCFGSRR